MFALQYFGDQARRTEGTLNITAEHAEDLLFQLNFAEECLQNGKAGMAADAIDELLTSHRNSPSLLLKIMLSDTCELLNKNVGSDRVLAAIKNLKFLVMKKCRFSQSHASEGVAIRRRQNTRMRALWRF